MRDGVSNHQPRDCLLNRLFRADKRKHQSSASLAFVRGISPVAGEFPAQMASNGESVSIWWRHHTTVAQDSSISQWWTVSFEAVVKFEAGCCWLELLDAIFLATNVYGCMGYVYCRNHCSFTFVLVWVRSEEIVIFTKFSFENDGGGKLGAITLKSTANPLSNRLWWLKWLIHPLPNQVGNVALRWVYQVMLVEMADKTLHSLCVT